MEFDQVVRRRHMVRSYRPDPVDPDVLDRILDRGRRGPSAGYSQGAHFLVLRNPDETAAYWDVALPPGRRSEFAWPGLLRAPVLVLVLSDKAAYLDRYAEPDKGWSDRDETRWPVPYWDVDAGMAAMLILLSAVDEGLGALFFGLFSGWEAIRERFGVPEGLACVGVIALGHPDAGDRPSGSPARGRRPHAEVVHWGRW